MDIEALVKDIIVGNSWEISHVLRVEVKDFLSLNIQAIPPPCCYTSDSDYWKLTSSGLCSLKLAWDMVHSRAPQSQWSLMVWNKIL